MSFVFLICRRYRSCTYVSDDWISAGNAWGPDGNVAPEYQSLRARHPNAQGTRKPFRATPRCSCHLSVCLCVCSYIHISMCIYVYIAPSARHNCDLYTYVCIYVCMYVCMYVSMYLYMYVFMYVHTYIRVCMYVHVYILRPNFSAHPSRVCVFSM